jgi:N-acetylglucosaminyldiphosphoundecaprenol N-acetyl-beta-D-mannosaminyltransferase
MDKVRILGVGIDAIEQYALEEAVVDSVRQRRKDVYAYVNVHALNIAQHDDVFREFLNSAAITYCDGEGVRVGARFLGRMLPSRIVLTYWVWDLCRLCEREGFSMFLLGGEVESVERAVRQIKQQYRSLVISGFHHGFFDKWGAENTTVLRLIEQAHPDVLIVGFGMPLQESWIQRNLGALHARVILPAGSMIEYVAGKKKAAPRWMANHGMEWVYRLIQEPRRLWRRYLLGNPLFMARVLIQRVKQGDLG